MTDGAGADTPVDHAATRAGPIRAVREHGRAAFARASEEPYRRRPIDGVVAVVALVVLVGAMVHEGSPGALERHLVALAADVPEEIHGFFVALLRLGALWAVALVTIAAFVAHRRRLARDLVIGGVAAWFVARLVAFLIDGTAAQDAFSSVVQLDHTPRFPSVAVAVIVAVVATAAPYLTRAMRVLGVVVVLLAAVGAVAVGHAYPNDVVAALALGVLLGAGIHLAFGSPGGRPTLAQIELALAELGVAVRDLTVRPDSPMGRTLLDGTSDDGPVEVTVIGRDERDARYLSKALRFLVYRDSGPALFHSRLQEVEHEAYVVLRAEQAGVRVPGLVEVGLAGPQAAVLVQRSVPGPALAVAEGVTEELLVATWRQVGTLHGARIAHGALDAGAVVVGPDGPVLTSLRAASSAAPPARLGADVATLLATTATIVGDDAAVRAARAGLDDDALGAALPYLQPSVLPRASRARVPKAKDALAKLRTAVATALGIDEPHVEELRRVTPGQILTFAMTIFGVWALLGVIGDPVQLWDEIKGADVLLVIVGFALWILTNLTYATSALGGLPPAADVPLGPLTIVQSAGSFLNLATPAGVGTMLMNIRFLQKRGVPAPTAVASGTLPTLGYSLVQIGVILLTGPVVADQISLSDMGIKRSSSGSGHDVGLVGIVVVGVALVVGVVLSIPKLRAKVVPPVVTTVRNVWSVVTSPRKLLLIVGGSIGTQVIYALILAASLAAFGVHESLAALLFVNTAVSLFASVIPVPGGMGVVEAGLTAGLTALGVDPTVATAAVMTDRLITAYVPPVIGWMSLRWLQHRDFV